MTGYGVTTWDGSTARWDAAQRRVAGLNVVDTGPDDGPGRGTVLLVHGMGGCWQHWVEQLGPLSRTHRVVAVDLPGFGASRAATWGDAPGTAGPLLAVVEALDLRRLTVVGHSMAGLLACDVALGAPERVDRVALIGGTITSVWALAEPRGRVRALAADPRVAGALARELGSLLLPVPARATAAIAGRPSLRRLALAPYVAHPDRLARPVVDMLLRAGTPAAVIPTSRAFLRGAMGSARVQRLRQPVLTIRGSVDRLVPPADAAAFAALIPAARAIEVAGTGHMPHVERPAQVTAMLSEFACG